MFRLMPDASDAGRFQLGGGEGHVNTSRQFTALFSIVLWEPGGPLVGDERKSEVGGRKT